MQSGTNRAEAAGANLNKGKTQYFTYMSFPDNVNEETFELNPGKVKCFCSLFFFLPTFFFYPL